MLRFMETTRSVDPKVTESFLMTQDGVLDASVWFDHGKLRAHVTLEATAECDPKKLSELCAVTVGRDHTPSEFVVIDASNRVA